MLYHILYTDSKGKIHSVNKKYKTFKAVEQWLYRIKAIDWEIGIPDALLKETLKELRSEEPC